MILFHQYIIQLVRYLFRYQQDSVPEIDFQRAACLRFRVGEYKGFSEDVGVIDDRERVEQNLLSWLEKTRWINRIRLKISRAYHYSKNISTKWTFLMRISMAVT